MSPLTIIPKIQAKKTPARGWRKSKSVNCGLELGGFRITNSVYPTYLFNTAKGFTEKV